MGTLDEHWCTLCKKHLDKKKDKYIEFEVINAEKKGAFPIKLKRKKLKGNICADCLETNPELQKSVAQMIKAGNPLFKPVITCESNGCETFEPSNQAGVSCAHITIIGDKLYCKRSHVGSLILPMEKAEVKREEAQILRKMLDRYIKNPEIKELLKTQLLDKDFLKTLYNPPSAVVDAKKEESS